MADGADERLVVMLEARISEFEKRMATAERRGTRTYGALRKGARTAATSMERDLAQSSARVNQSLASVSAGVGKLATAFAGGLIAGGVAALVERIGSASRQTIKDIAAIADEAERAGVGVEAFQQWGFVASQNRIQLDAVTDGLKELNLRADEWITTGAGAGAEAFERLGFRVDTLAEGLKDPPELLAEIIGRLGDLDKAAQIRVADEVFGGTAGERFVELIDLGEDGLRAQLDRAREIGVVIDEDMVRKAQELDAKLEEVTARMRGLWQAGVLGAAEFFGLIEAEREAMAFAPDTAARVIGETLTDTLAALPEVTVEARAAIEGLVVEYAALGDEARTLVGGLNDAAIMLRGVGSEAEAAELSRLANDLGAAARAFDDGTISGEEFAGKLSEVIGQIDATIAEMGDLDRARLSGVIGAVQTLYGWIASLPGAVREAKAEIASAEGLAAGGRGDGMAEWQRRTLDGQSKYAPTTSPRPKAAPSYMGEPLTETKRSGGGADSTSRRVEALLEDLQTEREILESWYAEGLELINGATDAELEAVGGRHEALERLEEEHQDRMRGIRDLANTGALANAENFFGAMATLTAAGGDRLVKAARVFSAAEALINTYRAQAQVLADPRLSFWQKLPAAAAIGAAGLKLVSAIKGGGGGGGGSSKASASSGSASSAASEQEPMRVLLQGLDPRAIYTGQALIDLADGLQKEFGNRGIVLGVAK